MAGISLSEHRQSTTRMSLFSPDCLNSLHNESESWDEHIRKYRVSIYVAYFGVSFNISSSNIEYLET